MDDMLTFSVSNWGVTFSTAPLYFNIDWSLIIIVTALMITRKVIKAKRG